MIAAEGAGQTAYRIVESLGSGGAVLAMSVTTVPELAHGVARANTEARRRAQQRFLDDLPAGMPVHPVVIPVALRARQMDGLLAVERAQGSAGRSSDRRDGS